jgi:hypothetical protein
VVQGDGLRNRRLASFSLRLLNGTKDNGVNCARKCAPSAMLKPRCVRTMQTTREVAFSGKGNGLSGTRLRPLATNHFRVSGCVSYTCRRAVRWPSG